MSFPSARPLDDADRELVAAATRTIEAHRDTTEPESDGVHTVGAAVRDGSGRVHVGVNLYHFTGGPCAELVALGAARAQGAREVGAIVAVGDFGRGVLAPCGRDRQVLSDYHPWCRVIVPGPEGGEPVSVAVADLLPGSYRASSAQEV
ncbi:cytidine deaminase family protein [Kytococcus sp. Marseille-QA3725]